MSYMKAILNDLRQVDHLPDNILVEIVLHHVEAYEICMDYQESDRDYAVKLVHDYRTFSAFEVFIAIKHLEIGICIETFVELDMAHEYLKEGKGGYILAIFKQCGFNVFRVENGELYKPLSLSACNVRNALWKSSSHEDVALGTAVEDCLTRRFITPELVRKVFDKAWKEGIQYEFPELNSKTFGQKD